MKTKHYLLALLTVLIVFLAGMHVGKEEMGPRKEVVTETIVDTITYNAPIPESTTPLRTQSYVLPKYVFIGGGLARQCETDSVKPEIDGAEALECGNDSAIVELPIVQRHYADSTYEAWVSGPIDPRLDSMRVFAPITITTKREWKPPNRWHVGVTAGYGYGAKGFHPYIGVGITYSIFSF